MLIWKTSQGVVPTTEPVVKGGFNWDAWYQKNKARLSEKRAKRYQEDAAYRQAALERSRQQRENKKPVVSPEAELYAVPFTEAADAVGVTVWVLREWRRKDYFPEPHRRMGRLWFSVGQVQQLRQLKQHFDTSGARVTEATRPALENLVGLIYANW